MYLIKTKVNILPYLKTIYFYENFTSITMLIEIILINPMYACHFYIHVQIMIQNITVSEIHENTFKSRKSFVL